MTGEQWRCSDAFCYAVSLQAIQGQTFTGRLVQMAYSREKYEQVTKTIQWNELLDISTST